MEQPYKYAITTEPTPAFKKNDAENKWDTFRDIFGGVDGKTLKLDEFGQIDELEVVIPKNTVIEVIEKCRSSVLKIVIEGLDGEYFIDERFLQKNAYSKTRPPSRERKLPEKEKIIENLRTAVGTPYIWGGNKRDGIPRLLKIYPPAEEIDEKLKQHWILAGVDCSGLLYEATNGFTPRNTSGLCMLGDPVKNLRGSSAEEISQKLEALDIIAWKGHVIIILDHNSCIESRLHFFSNEKGGITVEPSSVTIRPITEVLEETMKKRSFVEKMKNHQSEFVIRRWYKK